MEFSSLARAALVLTLVSGCAVNMAEVGRIVKQNHEKEMATETDPDARAYMQGFYDCAWGPNGEPKSAGADGFQCYLDNEAKTLASLRKQADSETRADMKQALARAATCIEKAPRSPPSATMPKPFGYPADVKSCLQDKRRAVSREALVDDEDWAAAEKDGSADAWFAFIAKHREDKRVPEAAKAIVKASAAANEEQRATIDEKLATTYPKGLSLLPAERRIMVVGPKGLRVRDLAKLATSKVSPTIVVARVKASSEPYKSFDADELGALKQLGIADDVVAAMIEVTTKLEEKKKSEDERQALRTELAALRKMIEEKQASGAKTGGQTVQTKDGPMDVLASCAKRLGAMKLCENIPFPGSTICKSTAESEFPCPDGK
jgi:hypothetical protein